MLKTRYSQRSRQRLRYCVLARVPAWVYDTQNRLIEVQDTTGGQTNPAATLIARYGYDPLDRRIWKEQYRDANGQGQSNPLAQAQRTHYLYADEGLIAESTQAITLNADGSVTASSTPQITTQYGPRPGSEFTTGTLFVKTKNSNGQDSFAYLHHDHLQTPLQATDKAGNVVWAASYNAFGKASITTPAATPDKPTITVNLRLPGQYLDEETGLHYNYRRYYDADSGRYVTQDPIGLEGGTNRFSYVNHDPLNQADPTGEVAPLVAYGLGFLGGAAIDVAVQLISNGGKLKCVNWGDAALSGLSSMGIGGRIGYMVSVAQIPKVAKTAQYAYGARTAIKREYRVFNKVDDFMSKWDPKYSDVIKKGGEQAIAGAGRANPTWSAGILGFGVGKTTNSIENSAGNCQCN
jgi:RHS repeat-associated protein